MNAVNPAFIPAIKEHINQLLDEGPIHTTSWMPGRERRRLGYAADGNWTDTAFDPIFWHGTRRDESAAAKCFGLFVCECVLERDEQWGYGHYEKNGVPIRGRTYFQLGRDD